MRVGVGWGGGGCGIVTYIVTCDLRRSASDDPVSSICKHMLLDLRRKIEILSNSYSADLDLNLACDTWSSGGSRLFLHTRTDTDLCVPRVLHLQQRWQRVVAVLQDRPVWTTRLVPGTPRCRRDIIAHQDRPVWTTPLAIHTRRWRREIIAHQDRPVWTTHLAIHTDGTNDYSILGGVFGGLAVLLIVVVIIIIIVLRRRKRPTERAQRGMPSAKRLSKRHSTKLRNFITRLALLHRDSNHLFQEEFDELRSSHGKQALQFKMLVGNKPVNRVKNRSQHAIPFDHARVALINSAQDYINASYIAKMVDPYWPDEINVPVRHGELTVTMTGVSVLETYAVRKIIVTMRGRQDLRVTQLCIRGSSEYWSLRVEQLIDFIRVAGRQAKHSRGPVTVHCK
ncbi:hypothetical protein C0Q70_11145 [Pomacea canaliculata]|uniref:Tyrosine-protein phosphatase domain-containing protein n=1 Tax=Pomacea canaliculata TaxID=400727 RepID=A0A2T7P564_POMCA|nr:hypothetical protein C0Q70_11145 [Pomacea canaliculata]